MTMWSQNWVFNSLSRAISNPSCLQPAPQPLCSADNSTTRILDVSLKPQDMPVLNKMLTSRRSPRLGRRAVLRHMHAFWCIG
jgi:hypothetical protein